jgi:enolase-phosphatase E1
MIKAIITDIEGTTSSLSFVKDVLFPYSRKHLPDYVRSHLDEAKIISILKDVSKEAGKTLDTDQAIDQLLQWITEDKKVTPLKSLQGLIWEAGYKQGDFNGHIYQDAAEMLKSWKDKGLDLYIYSSGSVYAQKLLFKHTVYGDLTPLFSGYFDTHIGGKRDASSYRNIAEQIVCPPNRLLFVSDIKEELDAAKESGFNTIWVCREGELDEQANHQQVSNFNQINLKNCDV